MAKKKQPSQQMSLCPPPQFSRTRLDHPPPPGAREAYNLSEITHRCYVKRAKYGTSDEIIPLRVWVKWTPPINWKEVEDVVWEKRKGRKSQVAVLVLQGGSKLDADKDLVSSCAVREIVVG